MRIVEITDKNRVWADINNVNIDVIKDTYSFLLKSLPIIIKMKSPNRSNIILGNVEDFVSVIDKILSIRYPDKEDIDIIQLNKDLVQMKNHVLTLSSQLKL